MSIKRAILQVADQGPAESLIIMLRSIGIECMFPSDSLRGELIGVGCDTVVGINHLVDSWGYEHPLRLPEARIEDMGRGDTIFVCVKGHRNYKHVVRRWSNLENRVLWYRINGGRPEHVIRADGFDCGDEINPPCPVLTPNQWYRWIAEETTTGENVKYRIHKPTAWIDGINNHKFYVCWPPFYRFDEYLPKYSRPFIKQGMADGVKIQLGSLETGSWHNPCSLIHNISGWGYQKLIDRLMKRGVTFFGVNSPSGLIKHKAVPKLLSMALAMIHPKSSDAPGYALYEAAAAGCPIICSRRLIWRCKMEEFLIPGETCLVFDRETHDELSEQDARDCENEIMTHLETLCDPAENYRIGLNARDKLKSIMWSDSSDNDVLSLQRFIQTNFGG